MSYKMDRSYAKIQTFSEADNHYEYWSKKTFEERLSAAYYLTCHAYGLEHSSKHKLDKSVCVLRKYEN